MSRTIQELHQLQALPLDVKVEKTKLRIREWVEEFGVDGVYVSFSGGKDSTVLLTICREMYPDIKAVFIDTGLEYPEIRDFVKTWKNVDWIRPKMNFRQVIEKYGYPFISKEVSECVYDAQKYLTRWKEENSLDRPTDYGILKLLNLRRKPGQKKEVIPDDIIIDFIHKNDKGVYKLKELYGIDQRGRYDFSRWKFLATCPYTISSHCCAVMKKAPANKYSKEHWRVPITAQMATESRLRASNWLKYGCNAFDAKKKISNPMSFWTEQDVLLFLYERQIPIASVYGEIVREEEVEGQLNWDDLGLFDCGRPTLHTTGCRRTGCMFCGYGCHLEKPGEGRFERLRVTHPKQYDYIMRPKDQGGLGYKKVIDWINEHGDLHIRY